nr:alkaline shock response membrane anchor protein AmaP [Pseudomonas sp. JUb96]
MRNFNRLIFVLFSLLLVAAVLIFVLENQQPASLSFLGFSLPVLPLSVFVLAALIAGLLIGPLLVILSRVFDAQRR